MRGFSAGNWDQCRAMSTLASEIFSALKQLDDGCLIFEHASHNVVGGNEEANSDAHQGSEPHVLMMAVNTAAFEAVSAPTQVAI